MMKNHLFLFFFCFSGLSLCAPVAGSNHQTALREKLAAQRASRARADGSESFPGSARREHNRKVKEINALLVGGARPKNNNQPLVTPVTQAGPKAPARVNVGNVKQQRRLAAVTSLPLSPSLAVRKENPYLVIAPESGRDRIYTAQQAAQASAHRKANKFLENKISGQSSSEAPSVGLLKRQIRRLQGRVDGLQRAGASALKGADRRFARLGQENCQLSARVESLQQDLAALTERVAQQNQQAASDKVLLEQRVDGLETLTKKLFNERDLLWAELQDLSSGLSTELAHAAVGKSLLEKMLAAEQKKTAAFYAGLNLKLKSIGGALRNGQQEFNALKFESIAASEAGKK